MASHTMIFSVQVVGYIKLSLYVCYIIWRTYQSRDTKICMTYNSTKKIRAKSQKLFRRKDVDDPLKTRYYLYVLCVHTYLIGWIEKYTFCEYQK